MVNILQNPSTGKQLSILNRLKSASTDRHNFIYLSINYKVYFKVDKQHLENITQHIRTEGLNLLYKIPNVHKYSNDWIEFDFIWLHSICDIYTMEETKSYPWGTDIEYKRGYSLYRVALLQIYLKRYINRIRHRMWHPDSVHVTKLKEHFDSLINTIS
jgi:hypothetical protein